MTEWLAFQKCLDVQEDMHAGWEDIFQTVLASATICATGNRADNLELAAGLMQCFTAQSMATDALLGVPWATELLRLSEFFHKSQSGIWHFQLNMSAIKQQWKSPILFNGNFRILKWRYLPYHHKIWPYIYMVQYLTLGSWNSHIIWIISPL
jgi:hypothetical protein